jgi:hypothetical protein
MFRERDHLFTYFYASMTPVVAVQVQASGWQAKALPKEAI